MSLKNPLDPLFNMSFKIATWNVNSLRVRLPHVLKWLAETKPDILVLQETKLPNDLFPLSEIQQAGYECVFSGQSSYNGVAVLSRKAGSDIVINFPELDDHQRRVMALTFDEIRILNLYVPNGETVLSKKYDYKLKWLDHLKIFLREELKKYPKLLILGDFNIAPEEIDVHDAALWNGKVLFSEKEREEFRDILAIGFVDCFRIKHPSEKSFTWWDYRMNAFKRDRGLRIDHILASESLATQCLNCYIDKSTRSWDRPSDHAIVIAEFKNE